MNEKRVRRLYRLDGLQLRMRVRRHKHIALHRGPAPVPAGPTERWTRDFVHDALADGRPFRVLTVVDHPGIVLDDRVAAAARLQLGRALTLSGEAERAQAAYREFLDLWAGADNDIPILALARAEYALPQ